MTDLYYVEDDQNIAFAVKEYLVSKSFHVTICATLAEARRRIKDRVPACVLFPRAMRKIAMLAWIFDECREGQIPRPKERGI